ncbi:MAG: tryptophan synthase subunit alpha, partial [Bacteroidota bacterium]
LMNRIHKLFENKKENILSIFFTAGFPQRDHTREIILRLAEAGADLIEIGMPFSDPIADGNTIQMSNNVALNNGITLELIFEQLQDIRSEVEIPLILMGYINPVIQFGIEQFVQAASDVGVDGFILPDLPMMEYEEIYKPMFEERGLSNIFLITPQTSEARIRQIDALAQAFIYMVSMDSTTGRTGAFTEKQLAYFDRIERMKLRNPRLIGFGISDHQTFSSACQYAQGAIIGSAFIKALQQEAPLGQIIPDFVQRVRGARQTTETV